jgi:hypothetical protein
MASASYNTTFSFNATIGEVLNITAPQISVEPIETTHLTSSNAFKEFIPGFGDGGEISLTINYAKAQLSTLYGLIRTVASFTLTFADSSTWTGSAFLTALSGGEVEEDNRVTCEITLKVTGKPTFTAS